MRQARKTSHRGVKQGVERRRRATSSLDVAACATQSNQLLSCKLRLFSVMPLDRAPLHTWLHHWQDEYDAPYPPLVLAGREPGPTRKDVSMKAGGGEDGQRKLWWEPRGAH